MADEFDVTNEIAKVSVCRPAGCERDSLNIHALDKVTRDLAQGTTISVDGKVLFCAGFRIDERGALLLRVLSDCFELTNKVP